MTNHSDNQKIQIMGAGGHGKVVIQTVRVAGFDPIFVFDDNVILRGTTLCGVPVKGIPKPVEKSTTMLCGSPFSHRVNGRAFGKFQLVGGITGHGFLLPQRKRSRLLFFTTHPSPLTLPRRRGRFL